MKNRSELQKPEQRFCSVMLYSAKQFQEKRNIYVSEIKFIFKLLNYVFFHGIKGKHNIFFLTNSQQDKNIQLTQD